jgi:hypothetical protein
MRASDPFVQPDVRVLSPEAFEFVLQNELKRALRSQNFLTLVVMQPTPIGGEVAEHERTQAAHQVAGLISRDVRETDLISETDAGRLSVVLLDADLQSSMRVIDRLMSRLEHYEFPRPLAIQVGAACCPTHGADADSLRRAADARAVHPRGENRGNVSNA